MSGSTKEQREQQFCVRWNSYQSNLQSAFPKLLSCEHFVDVTLACESRMVKCHKVVLSACSAYFEKLLVQNPCQHPIIFMKDMKFWEVQALVDFMYKGEVNVTQDELSTLLKAAEALEVRGLCGQQEGLADKLTIPRSGETVTTSDSNTRLTNNQNNNLTAEPQIKQRRVEAVVKEEHQPSSNLSDISTHNICTNPSTPDQSSRPQSSLTVSNVKQESRFSDNGGLFDDFDDDFYQDDNSLQIDETGSAYSLPGPSTQLDSSPGRKLRINWTVGRESPDTEERVDLNYNEFHPNSGSPVTTSKWRRDQRTYNLATEDLLTGESLISVATKYNIPRSTLHDYLKKSGLIPAWRKSRQAATIMRNRSNAMAKSNVKSVDKRPEVQINRRKRSSHINPLDIFMSLNSLWTDPSLMDANSVNNDINDLTRISIDNQTRLNQAIAESQSRLLQMSETRLSLTNVDNHSLLLQRLQSQNVTETQPNLSLVNNECQSQSSVDQISTGSPIKCESESNTDDVESALSKRSDKKQLSAPNS